MLGGFLEGLLEEIYFEELVKIVISSEVIIIKRSKKLLVFRNKERSRLLEYRSFYCLEGGGFREVVFWVLEL